MGGRCCSAELLRGEVCSSSSLSPKWGCLGRTGWEIIPRGLLSYGTLPHPLPMGCSASLVGADRLTALGLAGSGGPGVPARPRGLGGTTCCATACSSMTNGAIRAEA